MNLRERFAAIVKARRVELGLGQSRYADHLGVSEYTIGQWEQARRDPTMSMVELVCYDAGAELSIGSGELVDVPDVESLALVLLQHDEIGSDANVVRFWITRQSSPRIGTLERILDRLGRSYIVRSNQDG